MKSRKEILEEISRNKRIDLLLKLTKLSLAELYGLKEWYEIDYNRNKRSKRLKSRIDLLEEAIMVKQGDEEEIWDSLT